MKKLGITLALLVLLLMLLSFADLWHAGSLRKRSLSLKAGNTKVEVQKVLGRPTWVFIPSSDTNFLVWFLSVHSETWAYGSRFDFRSAFRGESPFQFRMFGPESNDVAVVFGSSGRVSQVIIPQDAP